jgi:hypothetical protein
MQAKLLFVNVVISAVALAGAVILIPAQQKAGPRPRLDLPGTLLVCAGLCIPISMI